MRLGRRTIAPPVPPPRTDSAAAAPGLDQRPVTHAEHVMGTVVSFAVRPAPAGPDPGAAIRAACALLHEADAVFSTWDPRSPLSLAAPR